MNHINRFAHVLAATLLLLFDQCALAQQTSGGVTTRGGVTTVGFVASSIVYPALSAQSCNASDFSGGFSNGISCTVTGVPAGAVIISDCLFGNYNSGATYKSQENTNALSVVTQGAWSNDKFSQVSELDNASAGSHTINCYTSNAENYPYMNVTVWTGVPTSGVTESGGTVAASTVPLTCSTVTASKADDVIFSVFATKGSTTPTTGTGYTAISSYLSSLAEYKNTGATGSYTPTWPSSSATEDSVCISFAIKGL